MGTLLKTKMDKRRSKTTHTHALVDTRLDTEWFRRRRICRSRGHRDAMLITRNGTHAEFVCGWCGYGSGWFPIYRKVA